MMLRLLLAAFCSLTAAAQPFSNTSLTGKYFFRHLQLLATPTGAITEMRTAYGAITFSGTGTYSLTGSQIIGPAAPAAFSANGTYTVKPTGYVTISNPQRANTDITAGLGQGALTGASTETPNLYDLFLAIPAPPGGQSNASLSGAYDVSVLEFPNASAAQMRNAAFRLAPSGAGAAAPFTVTAKSASANNQTTTFSISNATYSIATDGAGALTLPGTALLNGVRSLWVSADGAIALLGSTAPGGHDLWIAAKSAAPSTPFRNLYFRAGLRYESNKAGAYAGASNSTNSGKLVSSLRVRQPEGVIDLTSANTYLLSAENTGTLELNRLVLGQAANTFQTTGLSTVDSSNYELSFAIRAASPTGAGVFLNPQGVVNAASFAPVGAPLSPGGFFTLFGSGLAAATTVATTVPFPTSLGNVQVLINSTPAPLYLTSANQISALVPITATGTTASVVVVNNGQRSNTAEIPLSKSAPGIFTIPAAGTGPAALLHADFTLLNAASPARRGGTVLLFLTGLGATIPSGSFSIVPGDVKVYLGGRPATVVYKGLAPGLPGLYQINLTIPANAPIGSAIPLAIETPEAFHDMADIAITN